jgi:malonate decarboxylase delta subunit
MERLEFTFSGGQSHPAPTTPVLAGVLGSGNLEVLIEPAPDAVCRFVVTTSARGFGPVWQAVLTDVFARWPLLGVQVAVNDAGATPAVVSLRLDQAFGMWTGGGA